MKTALVLSLILAAPGLAQEDLQAEVETVRTQSGAPAAGLARVTRAGQRSMAVAGVRAVNQDAPVQSDDLWHLGSNTKAMTATLAARLVEAGVLDWDTTLSEALPDIEMASVYEQVTLADLLHHRSGLPANIGRLSVLQFLGDDGSRDVQADRVRFAEIVLNQPPATEHGVFLYSNAGYVIAGLVIEQKAGRPFEALMQDEVFEPLGMESAGWGSPGEVDALDQPRGHAAGLFGGLNAREPDERADNPAVLNSAGRAHMSLDDVLDFLLVHLRQEDGPYLSAESWARLHAPVGEEAYAMGWGVTPAGVLGHAGSNTMWMIRSRIDPERGVAAAAVVNDGRIDQVSPVLGRALDAMIEDGAP
ncbi:serine hydrolase [Oceanicaulis sp. MMSF_3324]|uniref:serine hydrolase domain-containing protein n=1 Tax=Oceanicaulis sp. MMSF_3324 TaxID=3046702 RepID=UPI00273E14E4|nr:serine hydrolase domain-containing protein [Oceanicaulis sp. MMSF_3324]